MGFPKIDDRIVIKKQHNDEMLLRNNMTMTMNDDEANCEIS